MLASDRHDGIEEHGVGFLPLVSETKLSFGNGGEPAVHRVQGMAYYQQYYRLRAGGFPHYGGCRPAILLVYASTFLIIVRQELQHSHPHCQFTGHVVSVHVLAVLIDGAVQVELLPWFMVPVVAEKHKQWLYRFVSALSQALKVLKNITSSHPPTRLSPMIMRCQALRSKPSLQPQRSKGFLWSAGFPMRTHIWACPVEKNLVHV